MQGLKFCRQLIARLISASFFCLFFSFCGCSTQPVVEKTLRRPGQEVIMSTPRRYRGSITCQAEQDAFGVKSRVRLSALSGFLVGPGPRKWFKNLKTPILRPFFSDGCSLSPDKFPLADGDSHWTNCCVKHDISYWLGGTEKEKMIADLALNTCIAERGSPFVGKIYEAIPGLFGGPNSSKIFRWGFGWNYKRPYGPLTDGEKSQAQALYGISHGNINQHLFESVTSLIRVCDSEDPVFAGFTADEEKAYELLNARSEENDLIEWAKFNFDKSELEVKLKSCDGSFIIEFYKNSTLSPKIIGICKKIK